MRGVSGFWLGAVYLFVCGANASVFYVTDTNDTLYPTSLRGAVVAANRAGGTNSIILGEFPGAPHLAQYTYALTIGGADEDASRTGDLDITRGHLTIASARPNVTIDATVLGDRVFQVFSNAQLTLKSLKIMGGTPPPSPFDDGFGFGFGFALSERPAAREVESTGTSGNPGDGERGGAIFNDGVLILDNCVITNNSAGPGGEDIPFSFSGGDGGGIYNSGTFVAVNCVITGNAAGWGSDSGSGGDGGGVVNVGDCTFTDCVISGNQAGSGNSSFEEGSGGNGGNGGGICNFGTAVLNRCIIGANFGGSGGEGNSGFTTSPYTDGDAGGGGGIYNAGVMKISASTICGNVTGDGGNDESFGTTNTAGAGGAGAGIFNDGSLSMSTCTVSGNICGQGGSGDPVGCVTGGAGGSGGGVYNRGPLELTSCTIVFNGTGIGGNAGTFTADASQATLVAGPGSGGSGGDGGGILNDAGATNLFLRNSLIAVNTTGTGGTAGTLAVLPAIPGGTISLQAGAPGQDGIGTDVAGAFTSEGFNLIGAADGGGGFINGVKADQVGSLAAPLNPLIGPLQMNGGPTPTHALLPGSPAINQGNRFGISTDQRGFRRPYHYPLVPNARGGDGTDIGPFELQPYFQPGVGKLNQ
jgi:hypothetical protein